MTIIRGGRFRTRLRGGAAMAIAIAALAGCSFAGIKGRADPPDYLARSPSNTVYDETLQHALETAKSAEQQYCKLHPFACPGAGVAATVSTEVVSMPGAADRMAQLRVYRDAYSYEMMRAYDLALQDYGRSLSVEGRGGSFAEHLLNLGLVTAAGISKVPETARVLNAIASGALGISTGYSETVLVEQTIPALLKRMHASQSAKRAAIIDRLQSLDVLNYPLSAVRLDLSELGGLASIDSAVNALNADAEQVLQTERVAEEAAKSITPCDGDDVKIMKEWLILSQTDEKKARLERVRSFLDAKNLNGVSSVRFVYDCDHADLRKEFINSEDGLGG